jgi:hypothetical protein
MNAHLAKMRCLMPPRYHCIIAIKFCMRCALATKKPCYFTAIWVYPFCYQSWKTAAVQEADRINLMMEFTYPTRLAIWTGLKAVHSRAEFCSG